MGYKTILVHCDPGRATAGRLKVALDLARRFDGHVIGLHVQQPFQAPKFADTAMAMDLLHTSFAKTARADEAASSAVFQQVMGNQGVSSEWRVGRGPVDSVLLDSGRFADLIILGQHQPDAPPLAVPADLVVHVAMATERPVLVIPYIGTTKPPGNDVMVCWNGSREAARAATGALPLLKSAATVTLQMIDPAPSPGGGEPGADVARWLARHGVKVTLHHDSADGSNVGGVILSRAADRNIDLIVMGLYGHSRIRELVLGGASRTLLASMTVPLLIAH
jgi:nucleotide-binding universal stress UspA family protein